MPTVFNNVEIIPGEISRGSYELIEHPTGQTENLTVIVACGIKPGPTLLLTGNIHGDEVTGIVVIHRILEKLDLQSFNGKIVCIPSLNPSGQRAKTRYPQFDHSDPNRKWPDSNPLKKDTIDESDWLDDFYSHEKTSLQEEIWKKVFVKIKELSPDYHVDLHTFSVLSIPFIFLDRVLYSDNQKEANALYTKTKAMVDSIGLTIVVESPVKRYVKSKLHRSTSGMTLNNLRIPSCTIELGPMNAVDPYYRDAAIIGILNLMRWAGMVDHEYQVIDKVPVIKSKANYRYLSYPQAKVSGIVDFQKNPGDFFGKNDILAIIRNIDGTVLSQIHADFDGFVIGWWNNIVSYIGNTLGMVAVEDRLPMVAEWPDNSK
ncbi:MAG: succinylglutamate desuccinylase/aspartoacylase family protein [Candidatus Kariarchaeaceae archaeon]|jgi:predicted deacylase